MKKILLLLCALLAGISGAKADPVSTTTGFSNTKVYTINTARGAWTLNTAGTTIASSHKTNGTVENTDADQSSEAKEFAIYQYAGFYYAYNLKAEGFLVYDGTGTKISPLMGTPVLFTTSGDASYPLRASTLAKDRYVNNNNSGGIAIDTWTYTDSGNKLCIEDVRDLTAEEITDITNAFTNSPMNPNKAFIITANRGTWCANAAGTSLATTATNTSPAEGYNQFAFVRFDNNLYIYNVGSKKFIKKDGSLKEGRGDAINVRLSGNNDYPYMFYFPDGNIYFNMQSGGGSYVMDTYSNPDAGNRQSLTIQDVNAYAAAQTEYNKTVSVTYKLMYNGEQVATATVSDPLGINSTLPSSIDKGIFNYTYSPSLIQSNTTTITVTATPIFTISPDYVGATWYNMYVRNNTKYIAYSASTEPYTPYAASEDDLKTKELQWAFVGNPFTTGIKVVNRAAGRNKSWADGDGNAVLRDGDTYWDIRGRNGGFQLRKQGTDYTYINQAGGSSGPMKFWNSTGNLNDDGSTFWVNEAEVETTTITYHVKYNGTEVASTTATAVVDDPTPLTKIPSAITRDFVTLTGDDTHNIVANDEIDLTATWTGPFEITDDYASAHWYDMAIRSNWYVTSDNTDTDGALKTVEANALGLGEDAYQWAFVGDPYHLKLYNKAKGDSKVYAWTSNANASIPEFVDAASGNVWCVKQSTAPGAAYANAFQLTIPDYGYQVNQFGGAGGSLKIWADTRTYDPGSALKAFDVPTNYATFLNEEVTPYMGSGYFYFTDAVKTAMGWDPSYTTSCTLQQYKDMRDALAAIDKSNLDNYNLPPTGYYLIQSNNYSGKYMAYKDFGGAAKLGTVTDATSPAAIVKLTAKDGHKYTISVAGKYVPTPATSVKIGLVDSPVEFNIYAGSGIVAFEADGSDRAIHCADSQEYFNVGWGQNAAASKWSVTNATSVQIAISAAGYATTYLPFAVTIPSGVKAYAVSSISGGLLNLTEIETTIPEGTPVILEGAANTYTFDITTGGSYTGDNQLTGTYLQMAAPNGSYILQKHDEKVGFYRVDTSSATPNIPANRAYLPDGSAGVKAFFFGEDDADAIKSVFDGVAHGDIYDLNGRKVSRMQKGGVYVVNGKKVIVK